MFVSSVRCVVDGSPLEPPPPPVAPFPKICMVLEENQDELLLQLADMQQQLKRSKEDAEYQVCWAGDLERLDAALQSTLGIGGNQIYS